MIEIDEKDINQYQNVHQILPTEVKVYEKEEIVEQIQKVQNLITREVQVPVEKIIERPVEHIVERPVERIVENIVY